MLIARIPWPLVFAAASVEQSQVSLEKNRDCRPTQNVARPRDGVDYRNPQRINVITFEISPSPLLTREIYVNLLSAN